MGTTVSVRLAENGSAAVFSVQRRSAGTHPESGIELWHNIGADHAALEHKAEPFTVRRTVTRTLRFNPVYFDVAEGDVARKRHGGCVR